MIINFVGNRWLIIVVKSLSRCQAGSNKTWHTGHVQRIESVYWVQVGRKRPSFLPCWPRFTWENRARVHHNQGNSCLSLVSSRLLLSLFFPLSHSSLLSHFCLYCVTSVSIVSLLTLLSPSCILSLYCFLLYLVFLFSPSSIILISRLSIVSYCFTNFSLVSVLLHYFSLLSGYQNTYVTS